MDAGRQHETPGTETEGSVLLNTKQEPDYEHFSVPAPQASLHTG